MKIYRSILLKHKPEDFIVREVPCEPLGLTANRKNANHTIVRLKKNGLNTFEAMRYIAEQLDIPIGQVQCLGLKDEDGITEQLISFEKVLTLSQIKELSNSITQPQKVIEIQFVSYATQGLSVKRLHGNMFSVCLRNVSKKHTDLLQASLQGSAQFSFINYYDLQRFGLPEGPFIAHRIGEKLIKNNLSAALDLYRQSGNAEIDGYDIDSLTQGLFTSMNPRKLDFFASAYTSYEWNNAVANAVLKTTDKVHKLSIFKNHDVAVTKKPNIDYNFFVDGYYADNSGVISECKKSRQSIISTNIFLTKVTKKSPNQYNICVEFFLPLGCYATMAIKQFLIQELE